MSDARLSSCAIISVTPDVARAVGYCRDVLGLRAVEHYGAQERFAALHRDVVEIILVQSQRRGAKSNRENYGAGYDAYLVPESVEAVDAIYIEVKARGAEIVQPPVMTACASPEFVLSDVAGRLTAAGRARDEDVSLADTTYHSPDGPRS